MNGLDTAMVLVSKWGMIVPILCALLTRDRKAIINAVIAFALTYGITSVLKTAVARPRPFMVGDAELIGKGPKSWSFPSGHASSAFTLATSAFLGKRVLGWIAFISAALIAYSRVYLGVHYWSDIIAGAILGIAVSYGVEKAMMHFEQRRNGKKRMKR